MIARLPALALSAGLAGCIPPIVVRDQESACRVAREMMHQPMSSADLVELTAPFPRAYAPALKSYQARLATLVMTGAGAAGIAGAFIAGFLPNRDDPNVKTGLYADIGVTLGLGVAVLISGAIYGSQQRKALRELDATTQAECGQ